MTTYTPRNPHRAMPRDIDPWSVPIYTTSHGAKLPSGYANRSARSALTH